MTSCPFECLKRVLEEEHSLPPVPSRLEYHERKAQALVERKLAIQQHFRERYPTFNAHEFKRHWVQACRLVAPKVSILTEEEREIAKC